MYSSSTAMSQLPIKYTLYREINSLKIFIPRALQVVICIFSLNITANDYILVIFFILKHHVLHGWLSCLKVITI